MALPEKVKIGPYTYTVEVCYPLFDDDGTRMEGDINYTRQHIRIREQAEERMYVTLIHEILHAVNDVVATELTEDEVTRLAPTLAQAILDNGLARAHL